MIRHGLRLAALGLLLVLAPAAGAKEESKLQILLLPPGPGGGNGNGLGHGPVGRLASFLQDPGGLRRFQLQVRGLSGDVEHALLARLDAADTAPAELCRFTTDANGAWNGTCDIGKGDSVEAPVDPRGKYLAVNDGDPALVDDDVLAGWLYGAPADDGPMTKVKEQTRLAPDETANPSGSVDARYDMRPNGKGSFGVQMRGVPAGDYQLFVDGVSVLDSGEFLTPNAGGSAKASFRTQPSNGNGPPHNKKKSLTFDPRRKLVELKQGGVVYFSGPMLAQIEGLNVCSETSTPLAASPAGLTALREVDAACETWLVLSGRGFAAGTYDVSLDGSDVADVTVVSDGLVNASLGPADLPAGTSVRATSSVSLTLQP